MVKKNYYKKDDFSVIEENFFNSNLKEICRLSKKRSWYDIVFQVHPMNLKNEDWFLLCSFVKKNGEIKDSYILIKKDLNTWITYYKNTKGYKIKTLK